MINFKFFLGEKAIKKTYSGNFRFAKRPKKIWCFVSCVFHCPFGFAAKSPHPPFDLSNHRGGSRKVQSSTALVTASSHGRKEVVRELLEARAAVDARDSEGLHALAAAAAANHFATVSALLSARAAVNVCDSGGATAAVWAAGSGCSRVLLLLLGAGADVQVADEDGGTPLVHVLDEKGFLRVAFLIDV